MLSLPGDFRLLSWLNCLPDFILSQRVVVRCHLVLLFIGASRSSGIQLKPVFRLSDLDVITFCKYMPLSPLITWPWWRLSNETFHQFKYILCDSHSQVFPSHFQHTLSLTYSYSFSTNFFVLVSPRFMFSFFPCFLSPKSNKLGWMTIAVYYTLSSLRDSFLALLQTILLPSFPLIGLSGNCSSSASRSRPWNSFSTLLYTSQWHYYTSSLTTTMTTVWSSSRT